MNIRFVKGLYSKYNSTTYQDAIFFATDKKVIIVNDVQYGVSSELATELESAIVSVDFTSPNTIKFTNKGGQDTTVTIPNASTTTAGLMTVEMVQKLNAIEQSMEDFTIGSEDKTITVSGEGSETDLSVNIVSGDKILSKNNGLSATLNVTKVTTGLGENVKEQYNITGVNGTVIGSIPVYKDSSLQSAVKDGQGIKFTYILANGTTDEVTVDLSEFIIESEFADGLEVKSGKVYVKLADDSEEYLTVSSTGLKLSGIDSAISTAVEAAKTEIAGQIESAIDDITASDVASTAITADTTHVGVAGTNVQAAISNLAEAIKTEENARIAALTWINV